MAGSAVATMVWSTAAMNIGNMIDGNTVRKRFGEAGAASGAGSVVSEGMVPT